MLPNISFNQTGEIHFKYVRTSPADYTPISDVFERSPGPVRFGASEDTPKHFAEKRVASRYGVSLREIQTLPPESPLHRKMLDIALIEELRRKRRINLPVHRYTIHPEVWNGEDLHPYVLNGVMERNITAQQDTFGPTPLNLAQRIARVADLKPFHRIADLCAGQGNLTVAVIKEILGQDVNPDFPEVKSLQAQIDVVEKNSVLRDVLKAQGFNLKEAPGVLEYRLEKPIYDRILMVPPAGALGLFFTKHAFEHLLKPGGKIVVLISEAMFHPEEQPDKKWINPENGKQYSEEWLEFLHNQPVNVHWELVSGQELLAKSKVAPEKNTRLVVLEKSKEVST